MSLVNSLALIIPVIVFLFARRIFFRTSISPVCKS
ncbi:hypothetical protein BH23ACT4_BH23ACT4_15140 [soil metagenome]